MTWGFIPGIQDWITILKSSSVNHQSDRIKKKNHETLSMDGDKNLQISTFIHYKNKQSTKILSKPKIEN